MVDAPVRPHSLTVPKSRPGPNRRVLVLKGAKVQPMPQQKSISIEGC